MRIPDTPRRVLAGLSLAMALAGCGANESVISPQGAVTATVPERPQSAIRTLDDEFAEVADSIAGFGGLYYDQSGRLTVVMQNPESFGEQSEKLQSIYANVRGAYRGRQSPRQSDFAGARVVAGEYSFRQLLDVYEGALYRALPDIEGLVSTDVDEVQNRIVVGVASAVAAAAARKFLETHGIDGRMVVVAIQGTVTPNALLSDPLRPVPGGARIKTSLGGGYYRPCTLGFNLLKYMGTFSDTVATDRYFVTASHCSTSHWALDYSQVFQGGSFAATEVGDYTWFTGSPCLSGKTCRYTEGTLYKFYDDSITSDDGRVAYPTSVGDTSFTSYKTITSVDSPYSGMSVHMIGATSGRQSGSITDTCIGVYNVTGWGNKMLLCQYKAGYFSANGDSGAPVITLYGDGTVSGTGLHWGNSYVGSTFQGSYFSPMNAVLGDFFYNLPGYQNFSPVVY